MLKELGRKNREVKKWSGTDIRVRGERGLRFFYYPKKIITLGN